MTPTPYDKILTTLAPESHVNLSPHVSQSDAGEPVNTTPRAKLYEPACCTDAMVQR